MHKTIKELVAKAETIGWTDTGTKDGRGHHVLVHENGSRLAIPSTPSDHRSVPNTLAQLERLAGRKIARPNMRRSRKNVGPSGFSFEVVASERRAAAYVQLELTKLHRELNDVNEALVHAKAAGNGVYVRRLESEANVLRVQIEDTKDQLHDLSA